MIIIERIGEVPLEIQVDSLKHITLKDISISMHRCILNNFDMSYSTLIEIDFRNAFMNNIRINNAILEKAKLILVESENSFYDDCNMSDAMLLHSAFSNSSFKNVNLSNAIVNDNDFSNCDFCGANVECDGFETCKLNNAIYNRGTRWKEGFTPDKYGAKFIE